jgi:hypothetical protein
MAPSDGRAPPFDADGSRPTPPNRAHPTDSHLACLGVPGLGPWENAVGQAGPILWATSPMV